MKIKRGSSDSRCTSVRLYFLPLIAVVEGRVQYKKCTRKRKEKKKRKKKKKGEDKQKPKEKIKDKKLNMARTVKI